ncbi:MAG: hypothetical protein NC338_06580 [Firmicutes bacterium]|nr:hypothetical protein [Bacillota bacterium]MCM1401649.1 hypothetical protein [Bacteroides sp.]MCM1477535.1 hypothetical protein [Bacteroides sp.]
MKDVLGILFYSGLALLLLCGMVVSVINMFRALAAHDYRALLNQGAILALCIAACMLAFAYEMKRGSFVI